MDPENPSGVYELNLQRPFERALLSECVWAARGKAVQVDIRLTLV